MTETSTAETNDPRTAIEQLGSRLRDFRETHGRPPFRRIAAMASSKSGASVNGNMVLNVMSGKVLVSWTVLDAILQAIVELGGKTDEEVDVFSWRQDHDAALAEHAAEDPEQRRSGRFAYISPRGSVQIGANNTMHSYSERGNAEDITTSPEVVDQSTEFLTELESEITAMNRGARRRLFAYRALRFTVLAASAVTPALALLKAAPWVTAAVGALAFLTEGAIQLTRLNDRAVLDIRRVSQLSREFRMFRTRVGDYSVDDNFALLVQRIEAIRQENDSERLNVVQQSFGVTPERRDLPA